MAASSLNSRAASRAATASPNQRPGLVRDTITVSMAYSSIIDSACSGFQSRYIEAAFPASSSTSASIMRLVNVAINVSVDVDPAAWHGSRGRGLSVGHDFLACASFFGK